MRMITKEQLEALRSRYPAGTRVELLQMDDVQAPPIGTKGTVTGVDDVGSLMVNWDNGSGLNVLYTAERYELWIRMSWQNFCQVSWSAKSVPHQKSCVLMPF